MAGVVGIVGAGALDWLQDGELGPARRASVPVDTDDLPAVTVSERRYGGLSLADTTLAVEQGTARLRVTCHRDGPDATRTGAIDNGTYERTQRVVAGTRPSEWQAEYACRDVCAEDDGMVEFTVVLDGRRHRTVVDPVRLRRGELPTGIERLSDHLRAYWRQFDVQTMEVCGGQVQPRKVEPPSAAGNGTTDER